MTNNNEFEFKFTCKGGTYIRSLARDIGEAVGSLGVMSALVRSSCGIFDIENGVKVEDFIKADSVEEFLIAPEDTINFEKIVLSNENATKILNGVFEDLGYKDGIYRVYNESEFWGVGRAENGVLKIITYVR